MLLKSVLTYEHTTRRFFLWRRCEGNCRSLKFGLSENCEKNLPRRKIFVQKCKIWDWKLLFLGNLTAKLKLWPVENLWALIISSVGDLECLSQIYCNFLPPLLFKSSTLLIFFIIMFKYFKTYFRVMSVKRLLWLTSRLLDEHVMVMISSLGLLIIALLTSPANSDRWQKWTTVDRPNDNAAMQPSIYITNAKEKLNLQLADVSHTRAWNHVCNCMLADPNLLAADSMPLNNMPRQNELIYYLINASSNNIKNKRH